jgi:RNA polymerase subunit RPABC4/transcription elongation factor Spt4
MSWFPLRTYCPRCQEWSLETEHKGCPCRPRGRVLVDPDTCSEGCDACGRVWAVEEGVTYCRICGHKTATEWVDEVVGVEASVVGEDCFGQYEERRTWLSSFRSFIGLGY